MLLGAIAFLFFFRERLLGIESRERIIGPPKATNEIVLKINKGGFHDFNGKLVTELRLARGTAYRLRFEYDEAQNDYMRDEGKEFKEFTHQFALVSIPNTVFRKETGALDYKNPTYVIEFMAGDGGTDEYLVACLLYCLGMEHLASLHVKVVPQQFAR